jgi:mRNA-degrading endonuclease RelE of RelBE toxin-antitoxin system
MYQVQYSDNVLVHIQGAHNSHPDEVEQALQNLENNPLAHAIHTGLPAIGSFYIEVADYSFLFDIDEEAETINILSVRRLAYIEKLIAKRYN